MANPTTNYGFVLPTSSDLVTDLPADFDVALQGVDTRLKALNPETTLGDIAYRSATTNTNTRLPIGTNGQVLAVSGGVPAWTTTADVTPLTTKGDLFTFTTVDARLGIGANGTVLTADSAEATGMKWAAAASGGKVLQVVEASTTTATASTSTSLADTTLTATITPTSASSKVLIIVAQWFEKTPGNVGAAVGTALLRGATQLNAGGTGANFYTDSSSRFRCCVSLLTLDSPATTSATTYKTQFNSNVAGQTVNAQPDGYRSSIVLMEIGA
jgi:hypothetical protein